MFHIAAGRLSVSAQSRSSIGARRGGHQNCLCRLDAAGEYSRHLTQHAIRLVQRNLTPGGDKNGADINLALDALEMAFTTPHINSYVIVGGDSDFLSLVEKLRQYDKKVFVVGGRSPVLSCSATVRNSSSTRT